MGANIIVKKGDISNGLDSIAEALGLQSGQACFINEYYASVTQFPDLAEPEDWVKGDMAATLAPVVLAGKSSLLLTLSCPKSLISYLLDAKLIDSGANIVELTDPSKIIERRYPDGAIITSLQANIGKFADALQGRTLVPSFSTPEAISCAKAFSGAVLLSPRQSVDFNSKAYLRKVCLEEGISMPPGIIIDANESLGSAISRFELGSMKSGLPTSPAWLKLPSVAGGGTIPLPLGPNEEEMESKIIAFMRDASGSYISNPFSEVDQFSNIPPKMKREMVLEYDMGSIQGLSIVNNFCCQAVIGENRVTYVGTTGQITENGDYIGGRTLSPDEEDLVKKIMPEIEKVLLAYQARGYRGYIGVDALIAETPDGYRPYVLETNSRMNASTPLLGITQRLSKQWNDVCCGEMVKFPVPVRGDGFDSDMNGILSFFNNAGLLYTPEAGGGIIPFMPDVFPGRSDVQTAKVRCAIVGRNSEAVKRIRNSVDVQLTIGR